MRLTQIEKLDDVLDGPRHVGGVVFKPDDVHLFPWKRLQPLFHKGRVGSTDDVYLLTITHN